MKDSEGGKYKYELEDLLTVEQAAKLLDMPEKTLRDWTYKRRIPFTRVGRWVRISRKVLESFLRDNEVMPIERNGSFRGKKPPAGEEVDNEGKVNHG